MHPFPRFALGLAMGLVLLATGCAPAPSLVSIKAKQTLHGPPDLVKGAAVDPRWQAYQLRAFQINHVWSGSGYKPADGGVYRLKLTIWDYADDGSAVAELYFHDSMSGMELGNPDPKEAKRPYRLHFPTNAIGSIQQALRNANEPIYLYYYDNQWAVGISEPEAVGVD